MGNAVASFHRSRVSRAADRKIFTAIGCFGLFCAATVMIEMVEKLSGSPSHNWSALRFMGPQIWLPLKTKEDFNVAIIVLIFSIMYAASCGLLIYGGRQRVKDLSLTWKLTEFGVLVYQIVAAVITANVFSVADCVFLTIDTVLGVLALIYTRIAESAWHEEEPTDERRRQRSRSPTPSEDEIVAVEGPSGISSHEARRSLEVLPGPSALAGPSGISRPSRHGVEHPMREIDGDSDSLEDVTTAIIEQPPPPVITPRRKKSSVRTAEVTVHTPPADLQEISVSADADRSLESIAEESTSDHSRGSISSPQTPPRHLAAAAAAAAAAGSETILEEASQGPSTSTAAPASTEQPLVAEARALQGASPSTIELKSMEQTSEAPSDASPLPSEASQAPTDAQPSTGASKPSQQTPSVFAGSSTADAETTEKPSPSAADNAASSLSAGSGSPQKSQIEAGSSQATPPADTGAADAERKAVKEASQADTGTAAEQSTAAVEVATEVRESKSS